MTHHRGRSVRRLGGSALWALAAGTGSLSACGGAGTPVAAADGDVVRPALQALFLEHEHPARVVLWNDPRVQGPVFEALSLPVVGAREKIVMLAPGVAVVTCDASTLDRLFQENPDGWAAFYRRYERSSGLIEVGEVRRAGDGRTATLVIGRSCGEHCRSAWRVTLRASRGRWRVVAVQGIRVPGG